MPSKFGNLCVILLTRVTGATKPDSKVIAPEWGREGGGGGVTYAAAKI